MPAEIKTLKFFEGVPVSPPDTTQPVSVGNATDPTHALTLGQLNSAVATLVASIALKVAKAGDTMSGILDMGTHKVINLTAGTTGTDAVNKTQMDAGDSSSVASAVATSEAYTDAKILALINASPVALDTLAEIATALGNDPSFSVTMATSLGNRLRVDTASQGLNTTQKANAKTNIDLDHVENYSASELASLAQTLTNKTFDKLIMQEQVDSSSTGANATLATPTKGVLKLTNASLTSVDMIPAVSGLPFMIINKTGGAVTFNNLTGATSTNQIETGTGANLSVANNASVWAYYSPTVNKTLIIGGSGSGGSSASKVIFPIWKKTGSLSPESSIIDGMEIEDFTNTDSQEIYATVKVPETYTGGSLISLNGLAIFSPTNTGNVFFKTQSTLLKSASTVIGTYTNQRTSTNAQIAISGTANQIKEIGALDLTDTAGLINGVAVAGGDKIRIRLYRDIASETSALADKARLLLDACEIKL